MSDLKAAPPFRMPGTPLEMTVRKQKRDVKQAWAAPGSQSSSVTGASQIALQVQESSRILPPAPGTVPTRLSTLAAALKSGAGKLVGQTVSSGIGELAGSGVTIGLAALDSVPYARIPMLLVKGALVLGIGGLAGYKAGQTVQEAYGVSSGVRAAVTLVPALVPVGLALGTGLAGGSLVAASVVLDRCLARMTSSVVRDVTNELGRGVLGDTRPVDAHGKPLTRQQSVDRRGTVGMLAPLVPNIGVAATGQFARPGEIDGATGYSTPTAGSSTDQFKDSLGEVASAAVVKGGYAFMLEGGRAVAALADGGGLAYVPGEGLPALARNLHDIKGTVSRAWEPTSLRIALNAVSSSTGEPLSTSVLQALGEARASVVEKAQAERERPVEGDPVAQVSPGGGDGAPGGPAALTGAGSEVPLLPLPQPAQQQLPALPDYEDRDDVEGSVHSRVE